jgi:hypothetical protein
MDVWGSGPSRDAQPSLAFTLMGGYSPGSAARPVRFRLGAFFGYTFLDEGKSKDTFLSLLVEPSLRIRLSPRRFSMQVGVGIGVLGISGLVSTSTLLMPDKTRGSNGMVPLVEVRPALTFEYWVVDSLALYVSPAIAYSPKKQYFNDAISRTELLAGGAFRF